VRARSQSAVRRAVRQCRDAVQCECRDAWCGASVTPVRSAEVFASAVRQCSAAVHDAGMVQCASAVCQCRCQCSRPIKCMVQCRSAVCSAVQSAVCLVTVCRMQCLGAVREYVHGLRSAVQCSHASAVRRMRSLQQCSAAVQCIVQMLRCSALGLAAGLVCEMQSAVQCMNAVYTGGSAVCLVWSGDAVLQCITYAITELMQECRSCGRVWN
jgi:hypothetical protein